MVCKPRYNINGFTLQPEFDINSLNNPANQFNQKILTTTNLLNNVFLRNVDLTPYPFLQQRIAVNSITNEEFADILITNSMSLEFVQQTFLNDFPIPINEETVNEIVEYLVEDQGFDREDIATSQPESVEDILIAEEEYYRQNAFNPGLCSSFSNPFDKIFSLIAQASDLANGVIGLSQKAAQLITDFKYNPLTGIISSLMSTLEGFQQQLLSQIDSTVKNMLSLVNTVSGSVSQFFSQNPAMHFGSIKFFQKRISDVREFFNKDRMDRLKNNVKSMFSMAVKQFEDVLPEMLNALLLNACGLSGIIDQFLRNPVQALQSQFSSFTNAFGVLKGVSGNIRNEIIRNGGMLLDVNQSSKDAQTAADRNNASDPENTVYTTDATISELDEIASITAGGLPGFFTFTPSVQNMGTYSTNKYNEAVVRNYAHRVDGESPLIGSYHDMYDAGKNGPDAGWKPGIGVKPQVYINLIRAMKATRAAGYNLPVLKINSAHRSRFYNWHIKYIAKTSPNAAIRSPHIEGVALDIQMGNNIPTDMGEEFIRQMARAGFGGISHYSNANTPFTHFDIGVKRTWGIDNHGKYKSVIASVTS